MRESDRTHRGLGAGVGSPSPRPDIAQRQEEREGAAHARRRLRSWISPPRSVASSRLMARPRPVPPYLRLVLASACWNASKMILCFSGGMPMPVSVTSKATTLGALLSTGCSGFQPPRPPSRVRRTPPCSVNLKAFDSRFFSTCCRRLESVMMLRPRPDRARASKTACGSPPRGGTAARPCRRRLLKEISSAST